MEAHEFRRKMLTANGNTQLSNRLWHCDIGKVKRTIKQQLINSDDIIELLGDKELEKKDDRDAYLYTHIFPYILIPDTIHSQQAYICFKVDDADTNYFGGVRKENPLMKVVSIQFMILCFNGFVETDYGIDRHDAIAYVIKEMFNWSQNLFGFRVRCVSDIEGVTDKQFVTRTLTFEVEEGNNLTETRRINPYGN